MTLLPLSPAVLNSKTMSPSPTRYSQSSKMAHELISIAAADQDVPAGEGLGNSSRSNLCSFKHSMFSDWQPQRSSATRHSLSAPVTLGPSPTRPTPVHSPSMPSTAQTWAPLPMIRSQSAEMNHQPDGTKRALGCEAVGATSPTLQTADPVADSECLDDTCFSTFSEVPNPNMTRLDPRQSRNSQATLQILDADVEPACNHQTPTSSSISSTPRPMTQNQSNYDSDTTNLLLDFTQQFEALSNVTQRLRAASHQSNSPSKPISRAGATQSHLRTFLDSQRSPRKPTSNLPSTPSSRNLLTLLEFEISPAPTPRSIPTITIRELESLKSTFASQISALKATLSGREAEVEALKRAIADAERRVGESSEQLREEKSRCESFEREKDAWEQRGAEFEHVLKQFKAEVIESEKDKASMEQRAEESEAKVRQLDTRIAELEFQAASAKHVRSDPELQCPTATDNTLSGPLFTAEQVQKQIDDKVYALSTDLHAIYKKKHITKVAGLKKGLEAKAQEKIAELLSWIERLEKGKDELQAKLDSHLSGLDTLRSPISLQRQVELKAMEENKVIIERQKAALAGRDQELKAHQTQHAALVAELERERVEKGELVAAVDEMLALQADITLAAATAAAAGTTHPSVPSLDLAARATPARPGTGLARPGFAFGPGQGSRLHATTSISSSSSNLNSGLTGRPPAGPPKSKMMSSIERLSARASDNITL